MMRLWLLLAGIAISAAAQAVQCTAQSGERTAALVELYTSEGCDSCPPADRWLSSLGARGLVPGRVVPVALHVDYWDYIGWKDPFARPGFTERQRGLAKLKRARVIYTPQVLLQGDDFRGWRSGAFEDALTRINARPARAQIALALDSSGRNAFEVEVRAELADPAQRSQAGLYLATIQSKLVSEVAAGENRGSTLSHDYVVFEWIGPLGFSAEGRLADRRVLRLRPGAIPEHSGVVAFVQNRSSAEVLQALMLPACS